MLKMLLAHTNLNEKAFWPNPPNTDFLKVSEQFWRKKYQEQAFSDKSELKYIFSVLFNAVTQLTLTQDNINKIISTLKSFQISCNTPLFANYLEGIKKKLRVITFYLALKSRSCNTETSLVLQLLDINVCPEGSFLKLQQIAYLINESSNIFNWLAKFRLEIIYRYLYSLNTQSIHVLNSILKYAQSIGLNVFEEDRITQDYIVKDQHQAPFSTPQKEKFLEFFFRHYCVEGIIQYITNRLEYELKTRLHEFQQEVPDLGWVISDQIPPYSIEKKLNGLPINKIHKLVEAISEDDDSYYRIKQTRELKKEVAWYLAKIDILQKRSKKIELDGVIWKFSILEGDYFGEYAYISNKVKPFPKRKFPPATFEEEKLYKYFSLEKFNNSKRFFLLKQTSFDYFYQKGADFNNCYLVDIDFKGLDTNFFLLKNIQYAHLIRPQVTYQQFLSFYALQKNKAIQSNCVVEFTSATQFFEIINGILDPELENKDTFIARHKHILTSKAFHSEFIEQKKLSESSAEARLKWAYKKIKKNNNILKFTSQQALIIYTILAVITTLLVALLSSCALYVGIGLLIGEVFIIELFLVIQDKIKLEQAHHYEQITDLKRQNKKFIDLLTTLIGLREELLIAKQSDVVVDDNIIVSAIPCAIKNNKNPSCISDYFKGFGRVFLWNNTQIQLSKLMTWDSKTKLTV